MLFSWTFFKKKYYLFTYFCVYLSTCMHTCVWAPMVAGRRHQIPWKWNYRGLWATTCTVEAAHWFSVKAARSTLNRWLMSPAHWTIFFFLISLWLKMPYVLSTLVSSDYSMDLHKFIPSPHRCAKYLNH